MITIENLEKSIKSIENLISKQTNKTFIENLEKQLRCLKSKLERKYRMVSDD